ncbi:MAG TPA: hypothetical protein VLV56_07100 [Burkholderiales bacterium]|nr:hypothetical protein [Burkholderiales bacterium]
MVLLASLVISWLLIACAVAWAVGRAADVGGPVQDPPRKARRPYARRRLPGKVIRPARQHDASPRQVQSRASRSVH